MANVTITLTPEMDAKIVDLLRLSGKDWAMYAAARIESLEAEAERLRAQREQLRGELQTLIRLAEAAMREANRDGAEYDIAGELASARKAAEAAGGNA